jgi:hypothetical protein
MLSDGHRNARREEKLSSQRRNWNVWLTLLSGALGFIHVFSMSASNAQRVYTKGPRQQADATTAAMPPAISEPRPALDSDITTVPFMTWMTALRLLP